TQIVKPPMEIAALGKGFALVAEVLVRGGRSVKRLQSLETEEMEEGGGLDFLQGGDAIGLRRAGKLRAKVGNAIGEHGPNFFVLVCVGVDGLNYECVRKVFKRVVRADRTSCGEKRCCLRAVECDQVDGPDPPLGDRRERRTRDDEAGEQASAGLEQITAIHS